MYTGTVIEDLVALVARAEQHSPLRPAFIAPEVITGGNLGWTQQPAQYEQAYLGVA
jgi:hypothetical protein